MVLIDNILTEFTLQEPICSYIKNYLQYYLNAYNEGKLANFYNNGERKHTWIPLSFKSNFKFNQIMSHFMYKLVGKYDISGNKSVFTFEEENNLSMHSILNKNGFLVGKIDKGLCDNILNAITKLQFKERKTNILVRFGSPLDSYTSNSAWCMSQSDILSIPEVQKVVSDEKLLHIIQEYLGAKPILIQTNLWFSQNKNNDYSTNAQLFHRDFDHERWIKVFFYLNNVTKENGAHCFVKGSHLNVGNVPNGGAFKRETDTTILQHYKAKNIIYHTGDKGTMIIEDTRGYHKGCPIIKGQRILLQLEFAINPSYGNLLPKFKLNTMTTQMHNAIQKYPYIFQNINISNK